MARRCKNSLTLEIVPGSKRERPHHVNDAETALGAELSSFNKWDVCL